MKDKYDREISFEIKEVTKLVTKVVTQTKTVGKGVSAKSLERNIRMQEEVKVNRKIFTLTGLTFSFPEHYTDEMCISTIEAHQPYKEEENLNE